MPGYRDRMLAAREAHDASLKAMDYLQTGAVVTLAQATAEMQAV
jgi:hypothetical protein